MPVWLWPIIVNILQGIWHAICRFWSVFLVASVLLSAWLWWNGGIAKIKAEACKQCISDYTKAHPTYGTVGSVTNNVNVVKTTGLEIDGWGIGVWHKK